jgi:hypothetical protein
MSAATFDCLFFELWRTWPIDMMDAGSAIQATP